MKCCVQNVPRHVVVNSIWVNVIITSLFSRTLGIMVYLRETIPFDDRKIQVYRVTRTMWGPQDGVQLVYTCNN